MASPSLATAKRIVIKIGSALLTDEATGAPHAQWMADLAADIAGLRSLGKHVILVSSGAVSLGRAQLQLKEKSQLRLQEKQAAAACGQVLLMNAWRDAFLPHNTQVAQILLTLDISEQRNRYLNARNTFTTLLELGVVPIVNENDTIATAELRFGDNDRLAARVAEMLGADVLLIFSDVDGFYTADPTRDKNAKRYDRIEEITPETEAMAGASSTTVGSGGMITKIAAAKMAKAAGCHMLLASGKVKSALQKAESGTWFIAESNPSAARKRWIAGALNVLGSVTVDAGAEKALSTGGSLLAVGVTRIEGNFERGEAVSIKNAAGKILGKGLIGYTSEEAKLLLGKKSDAFESLIGYKSNNALIHRDDMAME